MAGTIHLQRNIKAPIAHVYGAFQKSKALSVWYDPRCRIEKFIVGGKLNGDNYPSAEILALIPNHTIVHRYTDIVVGTGVWSLVDKGRAKGTLLVFDHLDAYESKADRDSISYYWKGLIENLAAYCEGRQIPFDHDSGEYKKRKSSSTRN